jgi:hypothetical protein
VGIFDRTQRSVIDSPLSPASGGGGGTPGGANHEIQYNSSGVFAGSGNLVYDSVNSRFVFGGRAGFAIGGTPFEVWHSGANVAAFVRNDNMSYGGVIIKAETTFGGIQGLQSNINATMDLKINWEGGDLYLGNASLKWPAVDGTNGQVLSTNGAGVLSWISGGGGGGANQSLSNLTGPTAINEDFIFDTGADALIRTSGFPDNPFSLTIATGDGDSTTGIDAESGWLYIRTGNAGSWPGGITIKPGSSTDQYGGELELRGGDSAGGAGAGSGGVLISSGSSSDPDADTGNILITSQTTTNGASGFVRLKSGGTTDGSSGHVQLETGGVSGGGTRGKIKLKDGSEGTSGYVWTSTGTDGEGAWMPGGGSPSDFLFTNTQSSSFWGGNIPALVFDSTVDTSGNTAVWFGSSDTVNDNEISAPIIFATGTMLGATSTTDGTSSAIYMTTGDNYSSAFSSTTQITGNINISTGYAYNSGKTGGVNIFTGNSGAAPAAGDVRLQPGSGTSATGVIKARAPLVLDPDSGSFGRPAAGSTYRGALWYNRNGSGVADSLTICVKNSSDTYSWIGIQPEKLSSDPSSPSAGDMYYNTSLNKLKVYNGTAWETVTSL